MPQDDWDKAAAVKRGECEWPGYDTLMAWIQQTPKSMLPGLLRQVMVCCIAEEVFREGGLQAFAARMEVEWQLPEHGVLRTT